MDEPAVSDSPTSCMSVSDFELLFGVEAIRTWVDWESLDDSNCTVRAKVLLGADALRRCQTVWYRSHGVRTDWRDPDGHRATVGEGADQVNREAVDRACLNVPQVFPALDLGAGEVMLLDGNHRAVALAALAEPLQVLLLILAGPRDPLVFPDLVHEVHDSASRGAWHARTAEIDAKFGNT